VASNSGELAHQESARPPAVDPRDEPSAEWGWHGSFPNGSRIAGVVSIIALVTMLFIGHETDVTVASWMLGTALIIVIGLVADAARKRNAWRR
jgi:hypothetical protein